mgnify:CR=1 FL=1
MHLDFVNLSSLKKIILYLILAFGLFSQSDATGAKGKTVAKKAQTVKKATQKKPVSKSSKSKKGNKKKSTVVFMESLNLRTKIRSNLNLRQLNRGTVLILTIKRSIRTKNSICRMAYNLKSLMGQRMPQVDFLSL